MTLKLLCPLLAAVSLFSASVTNADELADKGRQVLKKNQHAVVTVQVVIKATSSGRGSENRQEITGTVVEPSGLTVLALSACDPTEMYRRLSDDYRVEVEVSDIKILLDDNTELAAEIVLRDKDMDLAFIRPKVKPAKPMPAIDLSQTGTADILDPVISLNRLNKAANRAYAVSVERISAVIQKPRTFYIPDSGQTSTTLGSPAFLTDGKFLGIFVMRAVRASGSGAMRQNITSIILPASEISEAAKQAPEGKVEEEKKADAAPAAAAAPAQ
ncbi:MAG TPA: serine protease [Verrucomicrobiae bacterium]|nr:serine protease [Verrucomicrobiae bacterium]